MHIAAALLANQAAVGEDGLLYVQGGGWEHYAVAEDGGTVVGFLCGLAEFDVVPARSVLRVEGHSGGQVAGFSGSIVMNSYRKFAPFAVPVMLAVEGPGTAVFTISDENGPLTRLELELKAPPQPDPSGG